MRGFQGGGSRGWSQESLRYLTQAVFPVYILHQTIIVMLSRPMLRLELSPWAEGPLLVLGTFAMSFAGYEAIRRIRPLRPLFGLRPAPRPREAPLAAPQPVRDVR